MSKAVARFFQNNPILTAYVSMGLININALAKYIKDTSYLPTDSGNISSLSMQIRRYFSKIPVIQPTQQKQLTSFGLTIRTNISELIFSKTEENRLLSKNIFNRLLDANLFGCLVEGEKEIVLIADHSFSKILTDENVKNSLFSRTNNLGYISMALPIELRVELGVYAKITSSLAVAQIAIHSFHTLGGEILILVQDKDLLTAQSVLENISE